MNCIVTGAAGFIGSHLTDALLERGHYVIGQDNFSTGRAENLTKACEHEKFVIQNNDVRQDFYIPDDTDVIFHLAALGSVPRSMKNPTATLEHNVLPLTRIVDQIKNRDKKPRIVFASSSSVYGDQECSVRREDLIGRATSPYAASKQVLELNARVYAKCYGITMIGLRYFNVFGPRQLAESMYSAVIPKWAMLMLRGSTAEMFGDPNIVRDFTPVADVVRATMLAGFAQFDDGAFAAINVGTGKSMTLQQLYDALREITGYEYGPIIRSGRPGDVQESVADISRAEIMLKYEPRVSRIQALTEVVNSLRRDLDAQAVNLGFH